MVDLQTYPPAELPPFNSVGSVACHLLFSCHCYCFKESFQRPFPHFLQNDLFLGLLRQVHSHAAMPQVFSLVSLSLSSSSPDPPGLSITF